ncbi:MULTISPECIES: SDR family NAD(P)-dependent oxidoreductase [unclassified Kitasatospora]|uniref:SDR family NAD(P)-dependent oxidoreductase n=1 Tax=unclassified Kitasatospora TaxID=2633591 RepID=UPI0038182B56
MTTTLITGATRGIGLEAARQLAGAGHTVYLGARDLERGRETAERIGARAVQLDVTSEESVQAAARLIREEAGRLEVLVNNAGVPGRWNPPAEITADDMETVYATNVFGLVRVTHAFLPLLEAADHPVIVNVSSSGGSLARCSDPAGLEATFPMVAYCSSKSAVNMITVQYANAFPDMRINAVHPGSAATDFNPRGTVSAEQCAKIIVRMATVAPDGPTGGFFEEEGPVPW